MGNQQAKKILALRQDSNFLLTTILWGNVGINVLLTLLLNSVMFGIYSFLFSTFLITFLGEIMPQAYFSRHALKMASIMIPLLKIYQILLYPFAKPCSVILNFLLGKEDIQYFRERGLREVIKKHIDSDQGEIDRLEGLGALNFLAIDDLLVTQEGSIIDPLSIISLHHNNDLPVFPVFTKTTNDPFLQQINASKKKWVVLADFNNYPLLVMDSDAFLRDVLFKSGSCNPYQYCHRPIIVTDEHLPLGKVMNQLKFNSESLNNIIDQDIVLIWSKYKRIITGADLLGRLMRGITTSLDN